MAQIPIGNFGQQVARSAAPSQVLQGNQAGDAAVRLGGAALEIAGQDIAADTKRQQEMQRAQASLALAKTQNALHDAHDEIARGVLDGTIPTDKAASEFQKAASKARGDTLNGYQPEQRAVMDSHLEGVQGGLQRSLGAVVVKRQQQETAGFIDQFGEQVSREAARVGPAWAAQKFGAMVDFSAGAAGINEAQASKIKSAFSERVHATFYELAGTAALTKGDADALGGLVQKLQGPDGDPLDPTKRAQLTHQLFGWQQSVLAQKARAANAAADELRQRENAAVDLFNKGTDVALAGGYFSPDFIKELTVGAAGTKMQEQVLNLIASQQTIAGFASAPADQRAAMLERVRAARATPGQGTDPLGEKLLSAMTTMDSKMRAAYADNPWAAAQQAGVIQDAPAFNAADPATAVAIVQQRMAMIGKVEAWGGSKVSPLQPAEVVQVGKLIRSLPLDQAASMLGGMGAAVGDAERVASLAKQMHDRDGSLGLAMLYASAQTTEGRYTAELVLRGDQAIRDKVVTIDKAAETGWAARIAKDVRGTYSNREAEDAAVDAAFKIAAAKYAQNGSVNLAEAVKLATGGIVERNGQKFPLPYGMKEEDFDKRLMAAAPAQLAEQATDSAVRLGKTSMSVADFLEQLPKATLVDAGQGMYAVRAGSTYATGPTGRRIIFKVTP